MIFGSSSAAARGLSVSKNSRSMGKAAKRRAVSQAAYRGIEELENRWLLAANGFGVNFIGNNGSNAITMDPNDVAGVVRESHYNNAVASGTAMPLMDNTGDTSAGVTMDWSSPGFWAAVHNATFGPATGDQKLNDGFVYTADVANDTVTVNNIPFATYDVYVYSLNDGGGRLTTTAANGSTYYLRSATGPADANHLSGKSNTYQYTQATSTDSANPTANADYVLFPGQTGSTFSFTLNGAGNGALNGFQIVQSVIPDTPVLNAPITTNKQVNLTWTPVDGTQTYSVFRSDPAHPTPTAVGTNLVNPTYSDTSVINGIVYTYYVSATSNAGTSGNSNTQSATSADGFHSINVNFRGRGHVQGATLLSPTDIAGVFPTAHYNNVGTATGTNVALNDSNGIANVASLTFSSVGTYASHVGPIIPGNPDQALNEGFINSNATPATSSVTSTISNIPYVKYAVYVYELNDGAGRALTTTANGVSYYGTSADPADGSHINPSTNTPYLYTPTISIDSGNPTVGGDYVKFDAQTGSTFTFSVTSPGGNGYLNGFQIVDESPTPPSPVLADPVVGNNAATLNWTAQGAYTYTVYRSSAANPTPAPIANNLTAPTYLDTGLTNGLSYTYFITATNASGTSPSSNTKTATPQPLPPVAPSIAGAYIGNTTARLTWSAVPLADSYTIKRGTSPTGPFTEVASGVTTTSYADTSASISSPNFYVVLAVNGGGASGNSNVVYVGPGLNAISGSFIGNNGTAGVSMDPTDVAGVVPESHYTNITAAAGQNLPLVDSTGAAGGVTVDWSSPGFWAAAHNNTFVPGNGDQKLNDGFVYTGGTTTPAVVTVKNIPFTHYDVYVYILNDGGGRLTTTTNAILPAPGSQTYYLTTATGPTDANHLTGTDTPYQYLLASSTDPNAPTANGDFVLFSGQTGSTFTFSTWGVSNGSLNGFEIVNHPIGLPTAPVLSTPVVNDQLVRFSWTSTDAVSYTVMRSDPGHPTPAPVASNISGTTFTDTNVTNGTPYTYFVVASNPFGASPNSASKTVTPTPIAPAAPVSNITVARTNPSTVVLTWTGPEFTKTYTIARSTSLNGTYTTIASGITAQTFTDTSAPTTGNTDYFYQITPVNNGGAGPVSLANFVGHGTGFTASYYSANSPNLIIRTGDDPNAVLGVVKTDANINISGTNADSPPNLRPDWNLIESGLNGTYFAARWTGYLEAPVTGYYTLFPSSDDGIQVQFFDPNSQTWVIQNPSSLTTDRGVTEDTLPVKDSANAPVLFTAGQKYLVQIDYNQGGGGWGAFFRWAASTTTAQQTALVYDAMSKQLVQGYDVVAPVPSFSTVDTLGVQSKDQSYYTLTSSGLELHWRDIGADSYNVYRSISPNGPFVKVNASPILGNTVGGNLVSFIDSDPTLVNGTAYTYIVTGVNGSGETQINLATGQTQGLSLTVTPFIIAGTTGKDYIYVTQDPTVTGQIDWWVRATPFTTIPVGTAPTGTIMNFNVSGAVNILGKGGADTIMLDLSNGDFRSDTSAAVVVANSSPGTTLQFVGSSSGDTLQLDPAGVSNSGFAGTYYQTGLPKVLVDSAGVDLYKVSGFTTVNAYSGNIAVNGDTPVGPAQVVVYTYGPLGGITLAGTQHLQAINTNGGVATITGVVDVDSLTVDPTGTININGTLKVHYAGSSVLPTLLPLLISGRDGGKWDGLGITSTNAQANHGTTAIGYKDDGTSVVTLKYTRNGDANLDGSTGFADLVAVAQNYGKTGTTWSTGDFNYDNTTNFADLVTVAQNYGQSTPVGSAPVAAAPVQAAILQAGLAMVQPVTAPNTTTTVTTKPAVAAKPVAPVKAITPAKLTSVAKPLVVSKPAQKVTLKTTSVPFAPKSPLRSTSLISSAIGDVLEKKTSSKSPFA